jgi:hypothetical protein
VSIYGQRETLPKGTRGFVRSVSGNWANVRFDNHTGGEDVKLDEIAAIPDTSDPTPREKLLAMMATHIFAERAPMPDPEKVDELRKAAMVDAYELLYLARNLDELGLESPL